MPSIKYAVCWDECGNESYVECDTNESIIMFCERYPEYKFRYFKEEDQDKYYDNDQDCDHYDYDSDNGWY